MDFLTFEHFRKQLDRIEAMLLLIKHKGDLTMAQIDDLNTKIDGIVAQVTQLGTDLTAEIARLKGAFPDIAPQLAKLDSIAASLATLDTQATGA